MKGKVFCTFCVLIAAMSNSNCFATLFLGYGTRGVRIQARTQENAAVFLLYQSAEIDKNNEKIPLKY